MLLLKALIKTVADLRQLWQEVCDDRIDLVFVGRGFHFDNRVHIDFHSKTVFVADTSHQDARIIVLSNRIGPDKVGTALQMWLGLWHAHSPFLTGLVSSVPVAEVFYVRETIP